MTKQQKTIGLIALALVGGYFIIDALKKKKQTDEVEAAKAMALKQGATASGTTAAVNPTTLPLGEQNKMPGVNPKVDQSWSATLSDGQLLNAGLI